MPMSQSAIRLLTKPKVASQFGHRDEVQMFLRNKILLKRSQNVPKMQLHDPLKSTGLNKPC